MKITNITPKKFVIVSDLKAGQVFMFTDGNEVLYMIVTMGNSKYYIPLNGTNAAIHPVSTVTNFPVVLYTIEELKIKETS